MPENRFSRVLSTSVSRRKLIAGAGVAGGGAWLATMMMNQSSAAPQTGTGPATPNVLSASPVPPEVQHVAGNWPLAQGDLSSTRAAQGSPINGSTIGKLKTAWTAPITVFGNFSGITANAVILDNVVYLQDMQSNVFALDRNSGKQLWKTDFNNPSNGPNGVAVAYDRVYAATGDSSVAFCLDAKTGKILWQNDLSNDDYDCIDMAPLVYNNVVYLSTNPNNVTHGNYRGGARGILFAMDAKTGATLWSFDTAAENLWGNPRTNSGAGLWYPPSVDSQGNLYFGTGNPGPYPGNEQYPNGSSRPGPDPYSDSMVCLDQATGGVKWALSANPHDLMDHDFQQSPILATVTLNKTPTRVAIGSGKTGTIIAALADSGAQIWKTAVGKHLNDEMKAFPPGTTEIYPGALGGVESPIAFGDGKVFAPYINFPMYLTPTGAADVKQDLSSATGGLAAIDAATGKIVWDVKVNAIVVAGATVVNDLVLSGSLDGYLRAYDIKTGKQVWEFKTTAGLNAPPAVAGDLIVFAAGAPIFTPQTPPVAATPGGPAGVKPATPASQQPVKIKPQIYALKLGS